MLLNPGACGKENRGCRAFTLIELLLSISIIGMLIALLLPSLKHARTAAQDAKCMSNLKAHGIALTAYATDNAAYYPRFGDMTDECLRDLSCFATGQPSPDRRSLYLPAGAYHNQWDGAKNLPSTPLYTGQYLSAENAKAYQCPGNMRMTNLAGFTTFDVNRLWGDATVQSNIYPRYSYCYLAGIPHEGWDKNPNTISNGGDRNSYPGNGLVMRYNTMRGVDRRWPARPPGVSPYSAGAYPNMPYTYALMTDVTAWDGGNFDWPNHYWVNHSRVDQFFPNPINNTSVQDLDGDYSHLSEVCRSSNTVFADGHVITRRPDIGAAEWVGNQAKEPDTGGKLPMAWHYGDNIGSSPQKFFRYYW